MLGGFELVSIWQVPVRSSDKRPARQAGGLINQEDTNDHHHPPAVNPQCTPAERITRSFLGYGIIAGPMYVLISLGQTVTRDGFDLVRHEWSLLANGSFGWIQSANLVSAAR